MRFSQVYAYCYIVGLCLHLELGTEKIRGGTWIIGMTLKRESVVVQVQKAPPMYVVQRTSLEIASKVVLPRLALVSLRVQNNTGKP